MQKYKFIEDLTSDIMFEAYGKTLKEVFENAALALFSVVCQIEKVEPKKEIEITVSGKDEADLLFNWLQELIARVDIDEMFFSKFNIINIGEHTKDKDNKEPSSHIFQLKAKIYGEPISPERGETVVKSVTYHNYKLEKTKGIWKATVVCDI